MSERDGMSSETKIDFAKVTQMLDAGWKVVIFKNGIGSYSAEAIHPNAKRMQATRQTLVEGMRENQKFLKMTGMSAREAVDEMDFNNGYVSTDDFTPQESLTRLAYKVHGEIV